MTTTAVISVFCRDRPGVFAELADALAFLGADLRDMSAAVLGEGVVFVALSAWPGGIPETRIEEAIAALEDIGEARVHINPYPYRDTSDEAVTHFVRLVSMNDKPGDLAALCAVFAQYQSNLMRVNARRLMTGRGEEYRVSMEAHVPEAAVTSCMAGLEYVAIRLGYECSWEARVEGEAGDR